MRTIKFRGKAVLEEDDSVELTDRIVKHGDWVHGNLVFTDNGTPYIVGELVEVDVDYTVLHYWIPADCVGQFTGLHDKNGVEIYEGDIVQRGDGRKDHIVYLDGEFTTACERWNVRWLVTHRIEVLHENVIVIGNIHEEVEE